MTGLTCHVFCCNYSLYCDKIAFARIKIVKE